MLLLSTETDLESDPSETTNLKDSQPAVFAAMEERLHAIGATTFATDYTDIPNHLCLDAPAAIAHWRGFSGPYCGKFAMQYSTTTDSAQLKTDDLTSPVVNTKRRMATWS